MNKKLSILLFCLFLFIAERRLVLSKPVNKEEYGPSVRVSSAVFTIQETERNPSPQTKPDGKYKSKAGELLVNSEIQNEFGAASNEYLKFVGVIGSGHIYIPIDSEKHFENVKDGLFDSSNW